MTTTVRIGDISVESVVDGVARLQPTDAYERTTPPDWEVHRDLLDEDGLLPLTLGGYLIRTGDRVLLIDTGVGPEDRRGRTATMPGGRFLERLRATGTTPDDITDVVFTHLHLDHVGWAAVEGTIVFPNATYRCHEADWAFFRDGGPFCDPDKLATFAPQLECWDRTGAIAPGIDLVHAPGHTPGSSVVVLSDGAERAVLLGDVVHCPVELVDDEWETFADVDPVQARATASALAREYEGGEALIGAAHFPGLRLGRLLVGQGRRIWQVEGAGA
jgi:glyoxylase-like metal-dependent hydrolase (beta-lactamase superfamily II)